jgi:hypothetical protein
MKKRSILKFAVLSIFTALMLTGCTASCDRQRKDIASNWGGGLNRIVNIYSLDGVLISSYEGKIDIEDRENSILFDLDGKRYIYYNAIIEVIEK